LIPKIKYYFLGLMLCLCQIVLFAQQNNIPPLSKAEAKAYSETLNEANQKYEAKQYEAAAQLFEKAFALDKGKPLQGYYSAACSWSMAGNKSKAFEILDSILFYAQGNVILNRLNTETDFQNLRNEKQWSILIEKATKGVERYNLEMGKRTPTYYWGMYLGILFILFFYNLFLFFSIKDVSFLYYSLSVFFLAQLHTIIIEPFGFFSKELFFWFKYVKMDNGTSFFVAALMVVFHLLFVRSFLNLKENAPRINKVNNALIIYLVVFGIITLLVNGLTALFFLSLLIIYVFSFLVAIYCWRIGNRPAKFLVIASTFLTIGALLTLLDNMGITNVHFRLSVFRADNLAFISFYGLLSFALGDKINVLKEEKIEIQEKNLEVLEIKVKERTSEVVQQKTIIERKNRDITDSIDYAKTIQEATLPSAELLVDYFPDSFILYKPKDIVSGDFYWLAEKNGKKLIAACDCTGHGVPGALMSMVGNNVLNQLVNEKQLTAPDEILNHLHKEIRKALKQEEQSTTKDGMDAAIIAFNNETEIEYAGAQRPLWIIKKQKEIPLFEIKGDKFAIGGSQTEKERKFTKHTISLAKGDSMYIFSDGYADQFSDENKKLMTSRFKEILLSIQDKTMQEQKEYLNTFIDNWIGKREQIDDILVIGIRVG
jgi:serine phosphatase RsbU (regulator of sigma subunit)